ncbi:PLP-dependent aspartate aminotransferase family protein [Helicobacter sp. 11S02596-1]|uniref:trans-sulfuration enzyme family protein n=1 Tax=Helicobacter sp. 11S02596-1 TaxID=1476194 RepID=UPI000BA589D1|nr:PLP-dependent aspartate aminotransferase family protein [Helicobacter sp. 11S02596-1]PAF42366.1 cystathionine gamma-synthase [Helicobacter sp. 11S02596-1]
MEKSVRIDTKLIHGGIDGDSHTGAVNVPIYQTSTYKQIELGKHKGYEYSRTKNPTRDALEALIAELESARFGFAFASGMAAIDAVLRLFKTGDKLLISSNVYGGTFRILDKVFSQSGISYEIAPTQDIKAFEKSLQQGVKAILIESPANPLMGVSDIAKIAQIAKKHGVLSIVDNTFMTPYLQRPIKLGVDIVLHSGTKYLGGHSDLIAGLVVTDNEGLAERIGFLQNATGGILSPFESFLLIRGIKTLGVRMQRHCENALFIAEHLSHTEGVSEVFYPGLPQDKGYQTHRLQASGGGGMISFVLKAGYDYRKFFASVELIALAESLGGVESLLCHPASMTHASIPAQIRQNMGISDGLIRLSVGIEDKNDILADLQNAICSSREA